MALGLAVLAALGAVDLAVGTPDYSPAALAHLATGGHGSTAWTIVWQSRLPRFVLAALAGALLAVSGLLLQDAMRNPIAGPELLGVSSGSAAVMAAIIVLQLPVPFAWQPALALAGGVLGGGAVIWASWGDPSPARVILIGVAVSALLNAVITTIISFGQQDTVALFYTYFVGSLQNRTWQDVLLLLPWLVVPLLAFAFAGRLNVLRLGDEAAIGLGLRVTLLRLAVFLLAIALVAPVVAACGPIGYIALLAPHVTRRLLNTSDARRVLPAGMVVGAVLLTAADLAARTLFSPVEVPAGVWTTLVGGPLLLLVLSRRFGGRARAGRRSA